VVFDAFYWIINFGSFFASLLMPLFLRHLGPAVAFGVPGVLMFISTAILWLGRRQYVMIPPAPPNPHSFLRVSSNVIMSGLSGQVFAAVAIAMAIGSFLLVPKFGFVIAACLALVALIAFGGLGVWLQLDNVRDKHPAEAIAGVRSVLRVLVLFALVTPFWSLFDQKASTWVFASKRYDQAELVSARPNASAESSARDAPHSIQQSRALPRAQAFRIRAYGVKADDCWHRVCRSLLDCRRHDATGARPRQRVHDHVANAALCFAHIWRGISCGHRT
jgi:dipeptide/tripeptide permease